jgi:catechol 2,3-dioxygenase-like lactoylglutathione lyase family enzyme
MGMSPNSVVPLVHVADMGRSVAFYRELGFAVGKTFEPEGKLTWAWLHNESANLMLARTDTPVDSTVQAVLFYIYVPDVPGAHAELSAKGIRVGPIRTPFYAPRGEFRVEDPDSYVLMITHVGD